MLPGPPGNGRGRLTPKPLANRQNPMRTAVWGPIAVTRIACILIPVLRMNNTLRLLRFLCKRQNKHHNYNVLRGLRVPCYQVLSGMVAVD